MDGLKDNYGTEIGMRVTCQLCGTHTFRRQTGYNNVNAAIANRHSFLDQFEKMPEGWAIKHDMGGWLCPECIKEYNAAIERLKGKQEAGNGEK